MWLNQNFLMVDEYQTESTLDVSFLCLRSLPDAQLLRITMDRNGEVSPSHISSLDFVFK